MEQIRGKNRMLKIVVASYDAGGAEILSSIVAAEKDRFGWTVVAPDGSPAASIFPQKGLADLLVSFGSDDIPQDILGELSPDYLFTGTGSSQLELSFINEARKLSICSISFLDHWVNYRERFGFPHEGWQKNLPDYIAVADSQAFQIAADLEVFNLIRVKNYYVSALRATYSQNDHQPSGGSALLFISEAVEEQCLKRFGNARHLGYTQTDVLHDVARHFSDFSRQFEVDRISVRLHPFEPPDKFSDFPDRYPEANISIEKQGERKLNDSISEAGVVVGISSMALMIAHILGKETVSYIPTDERCALPLPPQNCIGNLDQLKNIGRSPVESSQHGPVFYQEPEIMDVLKSIGSNKNENRRHDRSPDDFEPTTRQGTAPVSGQTVAGTDD